MSDRSDNMRRDFEHRDELVDYLREMFPEAVMVCDEVSSVRGGREAGEAQLARAVFGKAYRQTRNQLDGAVSRLSPYIRHGVLSLREVRDYALESVRHESEVEKFINELGWRDFFQRNYVRLGDGIWEDIEPYKTGFPADAYDKRLPDDIRYGETGVPFIDDFVGELLKTGYLHNHARMWVAGYVVHWRRIRWQAGASWFLEHLLDGDPASNNLSWQWVASTFSHKPYYYNLDNIRQFTGQRYQDEHPSYEAFEGSYEDIARRLFPHADLSEQTNAQRKKGRR